MYVYIIYIYIFICIHRCVSRYGNIFPEISRSPLLGELQVCKDDGWENTPVVVQEAACRGSAVKQDCTLFFGYGIQLVFHKTNKFTWFEHESFIHHDRAPVFCR